VISRVPWERGAVTVSRVAAACALVVENVKYVMKLNSEPVGGTLSDALTLSHVMFWTTLAAAPAAVLDLFNAGSLYSTADPSHSFGCGPVFSCTKNSPGRYATEKRPSVQSRPRWAYCFLFFCIFACDIRGIWLVCTVCPKISLE